MRFASQSRHRTYSTNLGYRNLETSRNFKKDVKNRWNELNKSFSINKSVKKTNSKVLEMKWKNALKLLQKGKTNCTWGKIPCSAPDHSAHCSPPSKVTACSADVSSAVARASCPRAGAGRSRHSGRDARATSPLRFHHAGWNQSACTLVMTGRWWLLSSKGHKVVTPRWSTILRQDIMSLPAERFVARLYPP